MLTAPGQLHHEFRTVERIDVTIMIGFNSHAMHALSLFLRDGMLLDGDGDARLLGDDTLWSPDER